MPYAGEEPITSFFRRVTTKEKRKASSSSIHKRKRTQPDTEANKPPTNKKPKTQQELVLCDVGRNRGDPAKVKTSPPDPTKGSAPGRTESSTSILRDSSATSPPIEAVSRATLAASAPDEHRNLLPTPSTSRRHVPAHALQTPPCTYLPGNKARDFPSSLPQANMLSNTPNLRVSATSLPTPITAARHATRAQEKSRACERSLVQGSPDTFSSPASSVRDRISQPEFLLKEAFSSRTETDPFHWDDSSPTLSHRPVPSSQSQDDGVEHVDSFLPYAPRNHPISSNLPQSPLFLEPRMRDHSLRDVFMKTSSSSLQTSRVEDNDGHQYIPSSQSQHLLPLHVSPRKSCGKTGYLSLLSSLADDGKSSSPEETVPSSQTQTENELDISKRISDYHHTIQPTDGRIFETTSSSHIDWYRSAAKVTQQTSDEGLSSAGKSRNESGQPSADADAGSATEDESQNEDDAFLSDRPANYPPEPPDISTGSSPESQELMNYPSSLPEAVKEFDDMFDGGEGSYPDDFPMSLR